MTRSPRPRVPKTPGASLSASPVAPPTLVEAQALFQAAILDGDNRILDSLCDNSRTGRDTLFGVYRHGYVARLIEIVANDFEAVAAYLGADGFEALAEQYVRLHPSHTQNARYFSAAFPQFLRHAPETASRPEVADLATIEHALSDAFDAPDAPVLTLAGLAAHAPEHWGRLAFTPHASARLIRLQSNAFDIWQALVTDDVPSAVPTVPGVAESHILVWRQELQAMARALDTEEAMLWHEAGQGRTFDALCEMLATYDDPDTAPTRAAGYLQGWLSDGVLSAARLQPKKATSAARARR